MGVALEIGVLSHCRSPAERRARRSAIFAPVNAALRARGLPEPDEPDEIPEAQRLVLGKTEVHAIRDASHLAALWMERDAGASWAMLARAPRIVVPIAFGEPLLVTNADDETWIGSSPTVERACRELRDRIDYETDWSWIRDARLVPRARSGCAALLDAALVSQAARSAIVIA